MERFGPIPLASSVLDRAAELRPDAAAQQTMRQSANARFMLWQDGRVVFEGERLFLAPGTHHEIARRISSSIYLGLAKGNPYFIIPLQDPAILAPGLTGLDPRYLLSVLTPIEGALLSAAYGILNWHNAHQYCGFCGAPTKVVAAGWQISCAGCGKDHYPRTDPAVIMLVTRGNRLLIGRSPGWPERRYSLLAGFIEPGETLEEAVQREIYEEVGVNCGDVRYVSSQPWPFPGSLMIGCTAVAQSESIRRDPNEIEDALWVSREELCGIIAGNHSSIAPPGRGTLADILMKNWLADRLS